MNELLEASGPYAIVFAGMSGVITWLLRDRGRLLTELSVRTERLLDERQTRAEEALEAARLLSGSAEIVKGALSAHDQRLERLAQAWESLRG